MPAERRTGSLGLRFVEMFVKRVKGRAGMEARHGGQGTAVTITFPHPNASPG
jgi:two-component sensor histidine kinase